MSTGLAAFNAADRPVQGQQSQASTAPAAAPGHATAGHPTGHEPGGERRSYREAYTRLKNAQKSSKGAPAYSLYVNRPLGRHFAAAAYVAGRTPNQVTALSALFSFTGIALIALVRPSIPLGIAVAACLVIGYALDSADGQLSRLRGGGSALGEWLDHVIDSAKISCLHLAIAVAVYRFFDLPTVAVLVPLAFVAVANVSFFCQLLNEKLTEIAHLKAGLDKPARVAGAGNGLRALAKIPTDYGLLCLVMLLLGWTQVFFWCYAALLAGCAGYLLLALVKWFRDMSALADLRAPAAHHQVRFEGGRA